MYQTTRQPRPHSFSLYGLGRSLLATEWYSHRSRDAAPTAAAFTLTLGSSTTPSGRPSLGRSSYPRRRTSPASRRGGLRMLRACGTTSRLLPGRRCVIMMESGIAMPAGSPIGTDRGCRACEGFVHIHANLGTRARCATGVYQEAGSRLRVCLCVGRATLGEGGDPATSNHRWYARHQCNSS